MSGSSPEIAFELSRTVCEVAVLADPFSTEADPSVATVATDLGRVMSEQSRLYGALGEQQPGCDGVCVSERFSQAVEESLRSYHRIKPTIAAVEPAIVARQEKTAVAESYPALPGLVWAQADQAG